MILTTKRLLLRPIAESDANDIYEYAVGENVGIHAGWRPHVNMDETLEVMEAVFIGEENVFGIVLRDSNKLIGSIGLVKDPRRQNDRAKMLGYAIGEKYWGNGYMTEAAKEMLAYGFNVLQFDLISVTCYSYNQRSRRVIEKCGFKHEGTLRLAERRYDDMVLDIECYSLLREEWGRV